MRSAFVYFITFILLTSFSTGCAHSHKYRSSLRKATKKGQLYDAQTWNADAIWYATFFSDDFRREFSQEHATLNHLGPVESARWMAKQGKIQSEQWEFFVTIYTKKLYKKFSMEPESFWKIDLVTEDGRTILPTSIEMVSKQAYEQIMYTYLNRWSKSYRVTFPKVALGDKIELNLKSMVGKSTLKWRVK